MSEATRPKKGSKVQLEGLKAKPDLNGCVGIVIQNYDEDTGRCGIQLEDGTGVNAKPSNIIVVSVAEDSAAELELKTALSKLRAAGGTEEEDEDEDEDAKHPSTYVDELIAVGDARYKLGQYNEAGAIFYRSYYAKMHQGNGINNPGTFPVAHKMLQTYAKIDDENRLKFGHGMAEQTCMMPGCPAYIREDKKKLEKVMRQKGMKVESIMDNLRAFR